MFLKMGFGVYFFFASLMILSALFVFFFIPETKGLPLDTMNRLFEIKPVRRAHEQMLEELRIREEEFRGELRVGEKSGAVVVDEDGS